MDTPDPPAAAPDPRAAREHARAAALAVLAARPDAPALRALLHAARAGNAPSVARVVALLDAALTVESGHRTRAAARLELAPRTVARLLRAPARGATAGALASALATVARAHPADGRGCASVRAARRALATAQHARARAAG